MEAEFFFLNIRLYFLLPYLSTLLIDAAVESKEIR